MAERYAMCNELFEGPLADTAAFLAELGYAGLELAPYTLCDDVHDLTGKVRHRIRREIEDNGLLVVGLHWLLAHTEGKHLCFLGFVSTRSGGRLFAGRNRPVR